MALDHEKERRLLNVKLIEYYNKNEDEWVAAAQDAYDYMKKGLGPKATIRHDDVAKPLHPVVEGHEGLQNALATKKLTQKYWVAYFCDLILDRCWTKLR